jgi:hypothetical protein
MTHDLPARLLADRITVVLVLACVPAIEAMLARHPEAPAGLGVATGAGLLLWQWLRTRRRPCEVTAGADGVALVFDRGGTVVPVAAEESRVVGRSVVLHWAGSGQAGAPPGTQWLTPADLPRETLRALRVSLLAGRRTVIR